MAAHNRLIHWKNGEAPSLPFYASIFNYVIGTDLSGYAEADERTLKLVMQQPGFLGYESLKAEGRGMFISYWQSAEAIDAWRKDEYHISVKQASLGRWYTYYHSFIAVVESARFFEQP